MSDDVDIAKVSRNVQRLVSQNAPNEDISAYLQSQGVSADQLLSADTSKPGMLNRAARAVGDAAAAVKDAIVGKHDPEFKDTPAFSGEGISDVDVLSKVKRGGMVTYDDDSYMDVVKSALGKRVVDSGKDKNGYHMLTYRADDGSEKKVYLNKPGLDWQDVERAIAGSVPFMVGGGVVGGLTKGSGLLARMAAQAAGAGATSIGADAVAKTMGSEQGVDLGRAGAAALFAGALEGLTPAITAGWRRIFGRNGMVTADGALTDRGRQAAIKAGLDPDDMTERLTKQFAQKMNVARDEAEAAASVRTGEFDLPTTKGTRTKMPDQLGVEEEMRRGLMGKDAQDIMREFDKRVRRAVEDAAYNQVGGKIAPNAPGRERDTLGGSVADAVRDRLAAARAQEKVVWGETGAMFPTEDGFKALPQAIEDAFKAEGIRPKPNLGAFQQSNTMLQTLEDYMGDKLKENVLPLVGKGKSSIFLDDVRRDLLATMNSAEPRSADAKAARAVYNGFNKWIDDLAENAALVGGPDMAAKLKIARGFTRELKGLYEPRTSSGQVTPGGRILKDVIDNDTNPEGVINTIFGAGGPTAPAPKGSVDALQRLKQILGPGDDWDNVRLAHWVKIAQDNKGQVLSPEKLRNNIDAAFQNQPSVMKALYSEEELRTMRRLSNALEDVTYKPPNVSGTSYEAERLRQKYDSGSALKTFLQTQSKRELFSKHNVLMSRVYQMLAKKLPVSVFGSKEGAGAALARSATSDALTTARPPSFGGIGGAIGAEVDD